MGGWMDGWVEAKAGLRIAYSNQKLYFKTSGARWYMTIYRPSEPSFFAGVDNYANHSIKYARNVFKLYLMYYLETSKHGDKSI